TLHQRRTVNSFSSVMKGGKERTIKQNQTHGFLLQRKHVVVEEPVQFLVGEVDAQLFITVRLRRAIERFLVRPWVGAFVDGVHQPGECPRVERLSHGMALGAALGGRGELVEDVVVSLLARLERDARLLQKVVLHDAALDLGAGEADLHELAEAARVVITDRLCIA
ncbi:hypothetical protein EGW08_016966, partial [Elysia chlorotica]